MQRTATILSLQIPANLLHCMGMKKLPLLSLVALGPLLYSCGHSSMPLDDPDFSKVWAASPAAAAETPMQASGRAHALQLSTRRMNALAPSFSIVAPYAANAAGECTALATAMLDSGLPVAMQTSVQGKVMTFVPEYADYVVLREAHRNASLAATLPGNYKQALNRARQIVAEVCARHASDYERAVALHDYLALHTRYDAGLGMTARADAVTRLLLDGRAVCDGYAHAYGLLLHMAGIENVFVIGKGDGIDHIWNMAKLNGRWVHVDVTYDDPRPDKKGRVMHTYFGMTDAMISANHSWNRSSVPSATAEALYHPFHCGRRFSSVPEMVRWAASVVDKKEWSATVYVDSLRSCRTAAEVYARIERETANGVHTLRHVSVDKSCRAAIYCSFRNH